MVTVAPLHTPVHSLRAVSTESDLAELSTLRAQVDDLVRRITAVAAHYDDTPDSAVAADLFAAERSLAAARRQLDRAAAHLG
ncbi:MAG: hypothetical protein AMXMBFR46_25870 [Acidimicrobiia bacterium]